MKKLLLMFLALGTFNLSSSLKGGSSYKNYSFQLCYPIKNNEALLVRYFLELYPIYALDATSEEEIGASILSLFISQGLAISGQALSGPQLCVLYYSYLNAQKLNKISEIAQFRSDPKIQQLLSSHKVKQFIQLTLSYLLYYYLGDNPISNIIDIIRSNKRYALESATHKVASKDNDAKEMAALEESLRS